MTKDAVSRYSLHNIENFNSELLAQQEDVQIKYNNLISEYLFFVLDHIAIKNNVFLKFIIQRGITTITNVFNLILIYTKNLDVAYFHSQKAFYFYVEFIGQISEDQNTFLQLSSRDAAMFVYKKTIFEINSEIKKKDQEYNTSEKNKLLVLEKNQSIYQNLIDIFLENFDFKSPDKQIQIKCHLTKIEKFIENISLYKFYHDQIDTIILFIERHKQSKKQIDDIYTIMELFIKKYQSKIQCNKKELKNKILHWNLDNIEINVVDIDKRIGDLFL